MCPKEMKADFFCNACNQDAIHVIEYLNGNIKSITCSNCGLKYELIIEIVFCNDRDGFLQRMITKPSRLMSETREDLIHLVHSFPLRVVTKPYRIFSEVIREPIKFMASTNNVDVSLFCSSCLETTPHKLHYYKSTIQYSVCKKCGLKMNIVSLQIKFRHYPEELIHRVLTKPERFVEEIYKQRYKIIFTIPTRVVTKPYRVIKEIMLKIKLLYGS